MPVNIRVDGDVVVVSNFGRLMNDPRYVDASEDIGDLLDQGFRHFILDLSAVRETGATFLGVLMTITRRIRRDGGEAVLANLTRQMEAFLLKEMQMEEFWDVFPTIADAIAFFRRGSKPSDR
ncbi:MAG: STAS domain-containing protein [Isosphaeraceae bacterium]